MLDDFVYAGEHKVPVLGYGDVDLRVTGLAGAFLIRLKNVAYCENFACNLVSFRLLQQQGYWWDTHEESKCLRRSDGSILCDVLDKHNQFVLEYLDKAIDRHTFYVRRNKFNSWTARKPAPVSGELWHLRLGHPGPQALEHLVNSSQGVRIKGPTTVQCDGCGQAKIRRQIRREPREHNEGPAKRIAVDFHDYEDDHEGYSSLMLFTCRWSGMLWDYYLCDRKSPTLINAFASFLNMIWQQYGTTVSVIESDNEIGDQHPQVRDYLIKMSIKVELSPPYTQALNGGAESSGGVVKDKARAMRISAKLPEQLWREITASAVYLLNRTPRYLLKWKTPYEKFFANIPATSKFPEKDNKPKQAHLRAYGCKVFVMTTDAMRKSDRLRRLKPKAWIGYLVGYNSTNVYRIWNPLTSKIIVARDVLFNEREFFCGDLQKLNNDLKDDLGGVSLEAIAEYLQSQVRSDVHLLVDEGPRAHLDLDEVGVETADESLMWPARNIAQLENPGMVQNFSVDRGTPLQSTGQFAYPTPELTPPLNAAASMTSMIVSGEGERAAWSGPRKINLTNTWEAAFCAGRLGAPVSLPTHVSVTDKAGMNRSRRALERKLQTHQAVHRRDLPPVPKRHDHLKDHALGHYFEEAEKVHLQSHKEMKSWVEIRRNDIQHARKKQILDCMWVYAYKFDKHGRFIKCKARLVVRGDQQWKTLNEDTYAATLAGRSFRVLMATAARFDLELLQYDAVNAFVHAELDDEVYMKMPPGLRADGWVLKLQKALYGLRKSPMLWHKLFTKKIVSLGFVRIPHEPCCYLKDSILIFFYVDDIVLAFRKNQRQKAESHIEELKKHFALTGGTDLKWFLGLEIVRDRSEKLIWLSQSSYLEKIANLADEQLDLVSDQTPMGKDELLPNKGLANASSIKKYQRKIGSILFAAVQTRPDIAFAISRLSRFNMNPSKTHHDAADRVLRYLLRTRTLGLQFGGGDTFDVATDASFADNTLDRKSSHAYAMRLFGGLIGWRATKQPTVTTSTTEAELLAVAQGAKEGLFVIRLIKELGIRLDSDSVNLQCDNQQTIRLIQEEISQLNTRLRHVDIHNHWLRQEHQEGRLAITYVPTTLQFADGFTKALQHTSFLGFLNQLGLTDIGDKLGDRSTVNDGLDGVPDLFDSLMIGN